MPAVNGVIETALYVADLERSVRFYETVLGLPRLAGDDRFCALSVADQQVLLLFRRKASLQASVLPGGVIPPHDGSGELHVAFAIDAAELEAWRRRLAEQGVAVESTVRWE